MPELSGGIPVDPAYERFTAGLTEVAASIDQVKRWHGRAREWRSFEATDWIIDESNRLADTSASTVLSEKWNPHRFEVIGYITILWDEIQTAQASIIERYPKMENPVWTPWGDGDWRSAIKKGSDTGTNPPGTGTLPPEAERRIALVHEFVGKGHITPQVGNEIIASIVREYTD